MRFFYKLTFISTIFLFFNSSFCNQNIMSPDYENLSYFLNVLDISGDLDNIYIATSSGILKLDRFTNEVTTLLSFRKWMYDIPFKNLFPDPVHGNNLYFTGRDFLYHYDIFNDTIEYCKILDFSGKSVSLIGVTEESLFVKIDTLVYSSSKYGLKTENWVLSKNDKKINWNKINKNVKDYPQLLPHSIFYGNREYNFTTVYEDINNYYVGTDGIGFLKIDKISLKRKHFLYGTGSLDIRSISLDSLNNLWIAGLNCINITKYDINKRIFTYYNLSNIPEIPDNQINIISSSKKYVLFLTQLGGIFYYDISKDRFFNIPNSITTIFFRAKPLRDGLFIVSGDRGIGFVDIQEKKFYQKFDNIQSVIDLEVYKDTIYFVSQNKLYKTHLNDSSYYPVQFDFPTFFVYQFYKDDSTEILLDNAYIHIKNGQEKYVSYPNNLFGEFYDLAKKGTLIFAAATDGFGIFSLKQRKWEIFNKKRYPLPSNSFYNIVLSDKYLFVTTRSSLLKVKYDIIAPEK
ncbi:MAG: hypothetical protein ABIN35_06125 [candidate division WOR-3 bacterium]